MKKVTLITSGLIAGLLFATTSAMAAPHNNRGYTGVNTYQLERRIDAGVRSGKLVGWEARQLRSELFRLKSAVRNASRDHRMSRSERSRLERKEASLKRNISKLMNNREVARNSYRSNSHRSAAPAPRHRR